MDAWRLAIVGFVVLGIGVVVAAVLAGGGSSAANYTCGQLLAPSGTDEDGQATADLGQQHTTSGSRLDYLFCPPASGPHYSEAGIAPARPGFYDANSDIGPGSWVHNLEHGYVVALYRCEDGVCPTEAELEDLRRFVNRAPQTPTAVACGIRTKALAARFDDMATPFALVTWNRVLLLEAFDLDAALDYAQRWMEVDAPEANAC